MKDADQLLKVYNCCSRLPDIFFFWIALLQNKIIKAWHLIVYLFAIYCTINDSFDLIFFIISSLKFLFWL